MVRMLLCVVAALFVVGAGARAQERWSGEVSLPGFALAFTVEFTPVAEGEGHGATISIPMQGVAGLALENVVYTDERVSFLLGGAAQAQFECAREDADTARGVLRQGGQEFPVSMTRLAPDEPEPGPRRPQTPERPFPYDEIEVEFVNAEDGVRLAGTLSVPRGEGPHPAVVLITGSGAQDRDQTILGHKTFLVLSDHLVRAGIATLRADDRGVGGSGGSLPDSTAEALAGDARAGLALLRTRPEIDAGRLGLIGHSEGGVLAPMAAAEEGDGVAFIVLLAAPGVSGRAVMEGQLVDLLEQAGAPAEFVARNSRLQRALFDLVERDAPEDELREGLRELVAAQAMGADEASIGMVVDQQMAMMRTVWFRSFLANDPAAWLPRVTCPVLALTGSLDLQVNAATNLGAIGAALTNSEDVTTLEMPGLNHLLQTAQRGAVEEYAMIEETIAPAALEAITSWILERAGRGE